MGNAAEKCFNGYPLMVLRETAGLVMLLLDEIIDCEKSPFLIPIVYYVTFIFFLAVNLGFFYLIFRMYIQSNVEDVRKNSEHVIDEYIDASISEYSPDDEKSDRYSSIESIQKPRKKSNPKKYKKKSRPVAVKKPKKKDKKEKVKKDKEIKEKESTEKIPIEPNIENERIDPAVIEQKRLQETLDFNRRLLIYHMAKRREYDSSIIDKVGDVLRNGINYLFGNNRQGLDLTHPQNLFFPYWPERPDMNLLNAYGAIREHMTNEHFPQSPVDHSAELENSPDENPVDYNFLLPENAPKLNNVYLKHVLGKKASSTFDRVNLAQRNSFSDE